MGTRTPISHIKAKHFWSLVDSSHHQSCSIGIEHALYLSISRDETIFINPNYSDEVLLIDGDLSW